VTAARPLPIVLATLLSLLLSTTAAAERRFALVIGHNEGAGREESLRYARHDAERMAAALREVGDFHAADIVTLIGDRDDADDVREGLDDLENRIRATPGDTLLVVFYSGHADSVALHLGDSPLPLRELDDRLRASASSVRLLVLDACRAGTLTRVKGDGADNADLSAEGYAVVTAATASEDAAESDELQGSFFTHAFVSGLLGAADENGDRRVTLDEAYRHSFDQTVRRSTQSASGVQHPTYRYELRGRSDVVLSLLSTTTERSSLVAPPRSQLLVFDAGRVVAEVARDDKGRAVVVPSGRYSVVVRTDDTVYEGDVDITEGQSVPINLQSLSASSYARLVRKGGSDTVAPGASVGLVSAVPFGNMPWLTGMQVNVPVTLPQVTVTTRLDLATGWSSAAFFAAGDPDAFIQVAQSYTSLRAAVLVGPVVDLSFASLSVAGIAGAQAIWQTTDRIGRIPGDGASDFTAALGGFAGFDVGAHVPFLERWFIDTGFEATVSSITSEGNVVTMASPRLALGLWF
jgi:hypothetical protein